MLFPKTYIVSSTDTKKPVFEDLREIRKINTADLYRQGDGNVARYYTVFISVCFEHIKH